MKSRTLVLLLVTLFFAGITHGILAKATTTGDPMMYKIGVIGKSLPYLLGGLISLAATGISWVKE